MKPSHIASGDYPHPVQPSKQAIDTRQLGLNLRTIYEASVDMQPITDTQVDLLLRLRRKERELRRGL